MPGGSAGLRHGLVNGDVVHDGAHGFQRGHDVGIGDLGAEQEHLHVLDVLVVLERGGDSAADVALGHEVHLEVEFLELGGGGRSHGGEAGATEGAGMSLKLLKK